MRCIQCIDLFVTSPFRVVRKTPGMTWLSTRIALAACSNLYHKGVVLKPNSRLLLNLPPCTVVLPPHSLCTAQVKCSFGQEGERNKYKYFTSHPSLPQVSSSPCDCSPKAASLPCPFCHSSSHTMHDQQSSIVWEEGKDPSTFQSARQREECRLP